MNVYILPLVYLLGGCLPLDFQGRGHKGSMEPKQSSAFQDLYFPIRKKFGHLFPLDFSCLKRFEHVSVV